MRMIITLTLACLVSACGSSGGSSGASTPGSNSVTGNPPAPSPYTPPTPQKDYSTIACGDVAECSRVCDVVRPYVEENSIRADVCSQVTVLPSSCNSLVDYSNSAYYQSSLWCKALKTTEVMKLDNLEIHACADVTGCADVCNLAFQPIGAAAIKAYASAHGGLNSSGTLLRLLRDRVVANQLKACLATPYRFVIWEMLFSPGVPPLDITI